MTPHTSPAHSRWIARFTAWYPPTASPPAAWLRANVKLVSGRPASAVSDDVENDPDSERIAGFSGIASRSSNRKGTPKLRA